MYGIIKHVIIAHSRNAASGLIRSLRADPADYPVIQWQWKIDHVLEKGDAGTRQGDDYAARIYVAAMPSQIMRPDMFLMECGHHQHNF